MNDIINRFFLFLFMLPIKLYERLGADPRQLRSILTIKLMMDDRRPTSMQQVRPNRKPATSGATIATILFSAFIGLIFMVSFLLGNDRVTQLTLYFSFYIFMLASSLISDFTSVLIDVRDNHIIIPKPVNDRTIVISRFLHIMVHISKIILPMSLPCFIYLVINDSIIGSLAFLAMIIFASLFTIFIINALYIFILKVTSPSKFQKIIGFFQIFMAIFLFAAYQLLPRLMEGMDFTNFVFPTKGLIWMAPPFWFAKAWETITYFNTSILNMMALSLSILVPVASIFVVIKYLAPSFNQKLSLINSVNSEAGQPQGKVIKKHNMTMAHVRLLSSLSSKSGVERMSFLFVWKMSSRSKDFMLKVYPSIGYLIVMVLVFSFQSKSVTLESFKQPSGTGPYALTAVVYFSSLIVSNALMQITFSEKYKATWIFFTTPITTPGDLLSGATKAMIAKFITPFVLLVAIVGVSFFGISFIPNLVLAVSNTLFICLFMAYVLNRKLPFSEQQNNDTRTGGFIRSMFIIFVSGIISVCHYFIYSITPVVIILAVFSAIAVWLMQGAIKNISWEKVKSEYE